MKRHISEYVGWQQHLEDGAEDEHGNPVDGWAAPVQAGIYAFDPGGSSEVRQGEHVSRVVTEPTVYAPVGSGFGPRDRLNVRGVLYDIEGVPRDWVHPRFGPRGLVVELKAVSDAAH